MKKPILDEKEPIPGGYICSSIKYLDQIDFVAIYNLLMFLRVFTLYVKLCTINVK